MKIKTAAFAALAVILLSLTACKPTLTLTLLSADEKTPSPRFKVEDSAKPGERPAYDTVKLSDARGEILWHLRAEPFGRENSGETLTYAAAPAGFSIVVEPKPLQPGQDYILGVVGEAFGTLRFHVDADGKVSPK